MIQVRKAELQEVDSVMGFIRKYWKEDHILGNDKEFFCWMYVRNGELNFNIAIDDTTKKIYGINGFIIFNNDEYPDIVGSMWKVIKSDVPALGLELGEFAWTRWQPRGLFSIGMNERAARIEKLYGSEVAVLEHWYLLGKKAEYKVARILEVPETNGLSASVTKWYRIENLVDFQKCITDDMLRNSVPYKDYSYIDYRYFQHPVYVYQMYAIENENGTQKGVFVCREVEYEGTRICRIVDFYGDDCMIAPSSRLWNFLLKERGYEYIDFYCYGIEPQHLSQAGFTLLRKESGNIIPNYFEPFEKKNVEIRIVVPPLPGFHMYRGDGDQDRPSFFVRNSQDNGGAL